MKRIIIICMMAAMHALGMIGFIQAKNRGLPNLGNTCFMNATIQALSACRITINLGKDKQKVPAYQTDQHELQAIFDALQNGNLPVDEATVSKFVNYMRNHMNLNKIPPGKKEHSQEDPFDFLGDSLIQSKSFNDHFRSALFDLMNDNNDIDTDFETIKQRGLKDLSQGGELEKHDTKCFIFTLKRGIWDDEGNEKKINSNIKVPLDGLKITVADGEKNYFLRAVIIHAGRTIKSGHYYTIALDDDGNWWKYNDASVTSFNGSRIPKMEGYAVPYILFYEQGTPPEPTEKAQSPDTIIIDACFQGHNQFLATATIPNKKIFTREFKKQDGPNIYNTLESILQDKLKTEDLLALNSNDFFRIQLTGDNGIDCSPCLSINHRGTDQHWELVYVNQNQSDYFKLASEWKANDTQTKYIGGIDDFLYADAGAFPAILLYKRVAPKHSPVSEQLAQALQLLKLKLLQLAKSLSHGTK